VHEDILCFVEVKTPATRDVKPGEAAVDREKQETFSRDRAYLRHLPPSCQWRLEIIGVYYDQGFSRPQIELFRNIPA
jgi:Holliday junction resolvase-like predicted endonuclease